MSASENDAGNERLNGHGPGAWDEGIEAAADERLEDVTIFTTADRLLKLLRRAEAGESADLLIAEIWANAEHISK